MVGKLRNMVSCMSAFGCCCPRVHMWTAKCI